MPMAIEERPVGSGQLPPDGTMDGRATEGSIVTDHPFEPKFEWWSLCKECNLSEAAHAETTLKLGYLNDDED